MEKAVAEISVLLVEDERSHADLILRAFSRHPDKFDVRVATSFEEAKKLLDQEKPEVLISDLLLPDGYGADFVSICGHDCPVIIITAQGDERSAVETLKKGAWNYIVKDGRTLFDLPDTARKTFVEWKQKSQKYSEQERIRNRTRIAMQAAKMGSWDWNIKTNELLWSDTLEPMFGFDPGQFRGTYEAFFERVHPDDIKFIEEAIWDSVKTGRDLIMEHRLLWPDGTVKWVAEFGRLLTDSDGHPERMVGICHDITEQKVYESEREQLMQRLEQKNEELQTLMSVISHDVGNPLFSIRAFCSELGVTFEKLREILDTLDVDAPTKEKLSRMTDTSIPESLGFIEEAAAEISRLLEGLRTVAKVGRLPMDPQKQNMNDVLRKITGAMKFQIEQAHAKVEVRELPPCIADSTQIMQLFTNLIGNALKYVDPARAGYIEIAGCRDNNMVIYSVKDNGRGIEPHQQEKVFEIFHRIDPTATKGEGLGLTIVKRIVDKHNGRVWLDSEPGVGTTFYIMLPSAD